MLVILSSRATWAAAKDVEVTEKVWNASIMVRKSRVDIEICCGGGAVVLGLATSIGAVVLGVEGSGGTNDVGAVGNEAVIAGAGTYEAAR